MTESRKHSQHGPWARWVRQAVIALGLSALLVLSFHSASFSFRGNSNGSARHDHPVTAAASVTDSMTIDAQIGASLPILPSAAASTKPQPGRPDPADPANRQQTSLEAAAGNEHPIKSAPTPQGPPPQLRGPIPPSKVFPGGTTNIGGCLAEYGDNGQCLPVVPPSHTRHIRDAGSAGNTPNATEHRWSCGEVRKYFRAGLAVRQAGIDPQGLDTNGDGRACGPADR